ncbi:hypothetical protein GCM10011371_30170 [Novosphingobium marinum]|uniref:OOP family OmpA-OmpF porin n=1 Tax=Novosphingobium marinum TaxID=1514948 RepID=A0A7Z0BTB8_9SPHN|nr:OmpA family protein [Novosphingobium marinum]NYH95029.1 OOP family OmpA-OmpF porin [Novosphingobium marinum]GGC40712.1 hypothetical protein GCM10011371_30170 [Novosphingobium marinum]
MSEGATGAIAFGVNPFRAAIVLAGVGVTAAIAFAANEFVGPRFIAGLEREAIEARDNAGGAGIDIAFETYLGWLTRHAELSGGAGLDSEARTEAARAISRVPGVGGVRWRDGTSGGPNGDEAGAVHCQEDVEAILEARSIRFPEASADIDPASEQLLNEVAESLMPCVGSIIAITGHTDGNGDENANLALSRARANAVRWALIGRGIPADGLRATGIGSQTPLEGLDPRDPANRRIEFSVIESAPIMPTPIDTPGPG